MLWIWKLVASMALRWYVIERLIFETAMLAASTIYTSTKYK